MPHALPCCARASARSPGRCPSSELPQGRVPHAVCGSERSRAAAQEVAHRRPYEVILLARRPPAPSGPARAAPGLALGLAPGLAADAAPAAPQGAPAAPAIPDGLVLVACPAEHSRKPQLGRLLAPLLPAQPRCLEARPAAPRVPARSSCSACGSLPGHLALLGCSAVGLRGWVLSTSVMLGVRQQCAAHGPLTGNLLSLPMRRLPAAANPATRPSGTLHLCQTPACCTCSAPSAAQTSTALMTRWRAARSCLRAT